jgi:hypothetical protein
MTEGNYDDIAALVRHKTQAQAVVVMVFGGKRGNGHAIRVAGKALTREESDALFSDIMRNAMGSAEQRRLGMAKREVAPAGGEPVSPPKLQWHHPHDDDAQRLLRESVADEIESVCKKYGVGGVMLLCSRTAAAWRTIFPEWCGLQPDPVHVLRLRMSSSKPDDASCTLAFIANIREMCSDYANLYGRLWRQAVDALHAQGATVEHHPWNDGATVGGRPDPMGGKVE